MILLADMNFLLYFLMTRKTLILKLAYTHYFHRQFMSSLAALSGYKREDMGWGSLRKTQGRCLGIWAGPAVDNDAIQ